MPKREHLAEPIGERRPEEGWFLQHVVPSADNASFVLMEADRRDVLRRLVFRGRIVAESRHHDLLPFSFSPDGSKLAAAERIIEAGKPVHEISINGTHVYDVPYGTVHYLDWIDDERLAWHCWDRAALHAKDDGIRCFVNGEDVTGKFDYQPVIVGNSRGAVIVHDNGKRYVVSDDGTRSEAVDVPLGSSVMGWHEPGWPETLRDREMPETVYDRASRRVRMRYRGVDGPWFDEIETQGGIGGAAFTEGRTKMAHIGCEHSGLARFAGRVVGAALEHAETKEDRRGRTPLWAWPIALLFNPYFGLGHFYAESSKRYRPVDGAKPWANAYRWVRDVLYAPSGELVVIAAAGLLGANVVVDEDEGPAYDDVMNVRAGKDGRLRYFAVKGDRFFRVTVDGK